MEELRDVYNHFLLYYGSDIAKMRNMERVKRREERLEDGDAKEDDDDHDQIKQASRKSGYTICVKNKLGKCALRCIQSVNPVFTNQLRVLQNAAALQRWMFTSTRGEIYNEMQFDNISRKQ